MTTIDTRDINIPGASPESGVNPFLCFVAGVAVASLFWYFYIRGKDGDRIRQPE